MQTITFHGARVEVNDEGFFIRPGEWAKEMAPEIALREGIENLTEEHWRVVNFIRERYVGGKRPPTCLMVAKHCGLSVRELYRLFRRRPVRIAAKIAGVPEPRMYLGGCGVNWGAAWR